MKTKTFVAQDMRQAMKQARDELGADVVIIAHRRGAHGIELEAGITAETENKLATANLLKPQLFAQLWANNNADLLDLDPLESADNANKLPRDATLQNMQQELVFLRKALEMQFTNHAASESSPQNPIVALVNKYLAALGFDAELCQQVSQVISSATNFKETWVQVTRFLSEKVITSAHDLLEVGGVIALVGATGVGKTTTIAKLATSFVLQYGAHDIALVTLDSYRVAAREQLYFYSRILGVPIYVANTPQEFSLLLNRLRSKKLVLVDTAGISQRDQINLNHQLEILCSTDLPVKLCLVLAANSQLLVQQEISRAFNLPNLQMCMITKIDECAQLGSALSIAIARQLTVAYVCDDRSIAYGLQNMTGPQLICEAFALAAKHDQDIQQIYQQIYAAC